MVDTVLMYAHVHFARRVTGKEALRKLEARLYAPDVAGVVPWLLNSLYDVSSLDNTPCRCDMCGDGDYDRWVSWGDPADWLQHEHVIGVAMHGIDPHTRACYRAWLQHRLGGVCRMNLRRARAPVHLDVRLVAFWRDAGETCTLEHAV